MSGEHEHCTNNSRNCFLLTVFFHFINFQGLNLETIYLLIQNHLFGGNFQTDTFLVFKVFWILGFMSGECILNLKNYEFGINFRIWTIWLEQMLKFKICSKRLHFESEILLVWNKFWIQNGTNFEFEKLWVWNEFEHQFVWNKFWIGKFICLELRSNF